MPDMAKTKTKKFTITWRAPAYGRRNRQFREFFARFGGECVEVNTENVMGSKQNSGTFDMTFAIPADQYEAATEAWAKAARPKPTKKDKERAAILEKRVTDKRHKAAVTDKRHALATDRFPTIVCANCGDSFLARRADAVTCSPKCRTALYRTRRA